MSLVAVAAPQPANAAARVALVIGNSAYQRLPKLARPAADAAAMAALLRKAGYAVKEANNLGFFAFKDAIYAFKSEALHAEVAVIYFSGHGIGVDGSNYLLPIDARLTRDDDGAREGVSLDSVLSAFPSAIQLGLVILDASRARPLVEVTRATSGAVATNSGVRPVESIPGNVMVALAAKPGSTTKDGTGANSPYTAALLKHLAQPGLDVALAFARVRDEVVASTKSMQEPVVYGGDRTIALVPSPAAKHESPASSPGFEAGKIFRESPSTSRQSGLDSAWEGVKSSTNPDQLRAFIDAFPVSPRSADALARLDALERDAREREAAAARAAEEQRARELEYEKARAGRQDSQPPAPPPKVATNEGAEPPSRPQPQPSPNPPSVTAPAPAPAGPPRQETVDRFPTIEAVERVAPGVKTTVLVSLTAEKVTPAVAIGATGGGVKRAPGGALSVPIPPERDRIPLIVILYAPGFDLDLGTPQQTAIELDREGDSTAARFDITARPDEVGPHALRVSFWRDGEFLASASRKIEVVEPSAVAARPPTDNAEPRRSSMTAPAVEGPPGFAPLQRFQAAEPVSVFAERRPIDLTVEVVYADPRTFSRGSVTVASRYFPLTLQGKFEASQDLAAWIEGFYREFRAEAAHGDGGDNPEEAAARREARLARLRAFGDELYRRAAPAVLKQALATLLADPTVALRTVQIYSNNPLVPWELMRAPRPQGGATDFFGIAFALARWHEDDERAVVRPLQDQPVEEVVAIAPSYAGADALAGTSHEIEQIQALLAARRVAGRRSDFISLIREPPSGIVHFAGHGEIAGDTPVERRFAIRFEDGLFDVMEWRGLSVSGGRRARALFFFNACDVGQAESIAGAVEGWGPAALAKGASGYIGGLWPLKDDPASRFAVAFYQEVSERLRQGSRASVADVLAHTRRLIYETGDATYLAYAFYGDAQLEFVPANRTQRLHGVGD